MHMHFIIRILMLASIVALAGCGQSAPTPRSQTEFEEIFRTAFENGDRETLMSLVKWDGVPVDLREQQVGELTRGMGHWVIKSLTIKPSSMQSIEIDEKTLTWNLKPLYFARCRSERTDGTFQDVPSFYIGIENGVWRICGEKWQDSK